MFSPFNTKADPENLDNWRPISLLNIDYKMLAKILAKRHQIVLPNIICQYQQGFIVNRFIGCNIRLIEDVINYTETMNVDGAIIFLDFKKAFDTINWKSMFHIVGKFGFKTSFIRWVKLLYNNVTSMISNNGWLSVPFNISRGIRHGCPLSALLLLLLPKC